MQSIASQSANPTIYRTYTPQSPLSNFVDRLWLYENHRPSHAKERRLPDGSMELVINLHEDVISLYDPEHPDQYSTVPGSVVSGPHTEYVVLDTATQSSMMGIHFKPGGAFPFLRLPASELRDETVSLEMLWGATANELRDRLREASDADARFYILEQFLLSHLVRPLTRHRAVAFALKEFQNTRHTRTVADVTEQIGLSPKHFISIFSQEVGLTPKLFCRIHRFQKALQQIRSGRQIKWTEIALACGYFDQAHFIHDFQAFSGLNPCTYLKHQGEHHNHVPLTE